MSTAREDRRPVRAVVVGAGHRGRRYAEYAVRAPDDLQVTAVVEPDPVRRRRMAQQFALRSSAVLASLDALPAAGVLADVAIDATMDPEHVPSARRLLDLGYDVLLEKPVAPTAAETLALADHAARSERVLMVCHVLRHAPFYRAVKEWILAGQVGEVVSVELAEHVAYDHMAASYVRGRWASSQRSGSGILLSKCSHDLDLLAWLVPSVPLRVSSAGSRRTFTSANAPAGAGTRCLLDCAIEPDCPYSARHQYVDLDWWPQVWDGIESLGPTLTDEQKLHSLATDNPYGRCVWRSDNDVLDRQVVTVEFASGAIGSFTLAGGSAAASRTLSVVGTKGEVVGRLESGRVTLRRITRDRRTFDETELMTGVEADLHGGGDLDLVADFVRAVRGAAPSLSDTRIAASVDGHLVVYAAELARTERRWVDLDELRRPSTVDDRAAQTPA